MKKWIVPVLMVFLAAVTAPAVQSAAVQTSLVPEEAAWFIHLDVQKFAQTQLKKDWLDKKMGDFRGEISEIERVAQIDFFKDVSHVTVIGMGEDDAVVALTGKLNKDHLIALLKEEENPVEINYGRYLIYSWDDDEYGVFTDDSQVMIAESEASLKRVLDTLSGKSSSISATALASRLKSLPPENFLTAASVKLNEMVDDDDFPSAVLKNSKGAFFSASSVGDKLRMQLSLETDSPETAKNLGDVVEGFKSLLAMQEKIDPEWNLVKSLKMDVQGSIFSLEAEALVEEIIRLIN